MFVYAITKESLSSEWCQWEFANATKFQKIIIPVLFEEDLILPNALQNLQSADFVKDKGVAVAKLIKALNSMQTIPLYETP